MKPRITWPLVADPGGGGGGLSPATADTLGGVKAEAVQSGDGYTGDVKIDTNGKLKVKPSSGNASLPTTVELVSRGKFTPLQAISGTVSYTANAKELTLSGFTGFHRKPLVLPLTDGAEWTLTVDFNPTDNSSLLAAMARLSGTTQLSFPCASDAVGGSSGFSGLYFGHRVKSTTTGDFNNYGFWWGGELAVLNTLVNSRHVVQLRFKDGFFSARFGTPPTDYVAGTAVQSATVTWITGWVNMNYLSRSQDDAYRLSATTEQTKLSREFKERMTALNGAEELVFNGIGGLGSSPTYAFTGKIYSVSAEGSGFPSEVGNKMTSRDVRFLGSSIFYGEHAATTGYGLPSFLADFWGNDLIQTQCKSGTTLAVRNGYTDSYVERYENFTAKDEAEALVIQLSTNDFTNNVSKGSVSSTSVETLIESDGGGLDTSKTTGALEYIIAHAKHANPDVKIMVVPCPVLSGWDKFDAYGTYISGTLKTLREKWGFAVCDCYNQESAVDGYNFHPASAYTKSSIWAKSQGGNKDYFYDYTHIKELGYRNYFVPAVGSDLVRMFN